MAKAVRVGDQPVSRAGSNAKVVQPSEPVQPPAVAVPGEAVEGAPAAVWFPIDQLVEWAENPRLNDEAVEPVAESIRTFGFGEPIVARLANREIIAGHTRRKAALLLGWKLVPVRFLDIDEELAHDLALADNKLGEISKWNDERIASILARKSVADAALLGWSASSRRAILAASVKRRRTPEETFAADEVPQTEPEKLREKWGTAIGQVWRAGRHVVICGDSTDTVTLSELVAIAGAKPVCLWTDPPYGVKYTGKTSDALVIENDAMSPAELRRFLHRAFSAAFAVLSEGAPFYIAHPSVPMSLPFILAIEDAGGRFRQGLAWVKDTLVLGRNDYHYRHEPILYGFSPGGSGRLGRGGDKWHGDDSATSVFEVARPKVNKLHPTMKPPELIAAMLANSTGEEDVVLDTFLGSGSTMVACEAMGSRRCIGAELDPKYVAVILERMTSLGLEPTKIRG